MKITARHFAPWLAAVAAVGALAPVSAAGPLVSYPQGVHNSDHDEANQSAGALDQPF